MRITWPFFVKHRSGQRCPQLMTQALQENTSMSSTAAATAFGRLRRYAGGVRKAV
jgi:hypothetical protein